MGASFLLLHEPDHLTRIHLKIGLEDAGFVVSEEGGRIFIATDPDEYAPTPPPAPDAGVAIAPPRPRPAASNADRGPRRD